MRHKPDLTIDGRVESPPDRRCSMGHVVPEGATLNGMEVRFFRVVSKNQDFGLVCETCLTVARIMSNQDKSSHEESR